MLQLYSTNCVNMSNSIIFNYREYVSMHHPTLCTFSMLHQTWMKMLFVRLVTCMLTWIRIVIQIVYFDLVVIRQLYDVTFGDAAVILNISWLCSLVLKTECNVLLQIFLDVDVTPPSRIKIFAAKSKCRIMSKHFYCFNILHIAVYMLPFLSRISTLMRDIDIAILSICPSVTFRYQIKTA